MTTAELLAWLDDLVARGTAIPSLPPTNWYRDRPRASTWLAEAETALAAGFPPSHPIHACWRGVYERARAYVVVATQTPVTEPYANVHFEQSWGVVSAAAEIVRSNRILGVMDGIRAETVDEVLGQASVLLGSHHTVAAATLAGGALETHLLHLCRRHNLTWPGEGSIAKYDGAIAQARNAGTVTVYSVGDTRLVGAWGGMRNDAAHDPTHFVHDENEVRRMLEGIQQFIARVA
jgi:hypothetical protein